MTDAGLPEHFFRHEYGRHVALLVRRVGPRHLELVEDAVQSALVAALESWKTQGVPENPSAWLFRVALNRLVGDLRQRHRRRVLLERYAGTIGAPPPEAPTDLAPGETSEALLNLLFFCCDPGLAVESQLVVSLKTLCGFSAREVALRLFTTEENVYKRLARARRHLRAQPQGTRPDPVRVAGVQRVLYLLFSEGYLSTRLDAALRHDLCLEAIRLTEVLAQSEVGATPETAALLALMHLHGARSAARLDGAGALVLLEDQDRRQWDPQEIERGLRWLGLSARGDTYSRYHAEAAIAAAHCLAPSFAETHWAEIVHQYDLLLAVEPSALHELNRAVALAEAEDPAAALAALEGRTPPTWLALSFPWAAVLADLHFRCGHPELGAEYFAQACRTAPSPAVRDLLTRRLATFLDSSLTSP